MKHVAQPEALTDHTLEQLEEEARKLHATPDQRDGWNRLVQEYADAFLDKLPAANAFESKEGMGRRLLDVPIEEEPKQMEQLLALLHEQVDHNGINPASGKHFGYVPGGGLFHTGLGDYLAAATNRYAGIFFANPGAVRMENQVLRWMCDMVGFPETALGNLTSGGSIANLIAITTARDARGVQAADIYRQVIYVTNQTHHCVQKAYRIAGMSEAQIRYIPTDAQFRMNADLLRQAIAADERHGLQPFMIVGSGGTTDTGAIDPLEQMADIAAEHDCWYHVDAAYGGFFMLSPDLKEKFSGIERADSVVIDPHKGLFLSYGIGAVLIKDTQALFDTHHYTANYMQDSLAATEELSPADLSPELTKHFRGLRIWLPLQLLGISPFRAALKEKVLLCRYFYEEVQKLGFQVGPYPELSIMVYRYVPETGNPDEFNERLVQYVQDDGRIFVSSTQIEGEYWIRLAVLSFRTHKEEVDLALEVLQAGVETLLEKQHTEN